MRIPIFCKNKRCGADYHYSDSCPLDRYYPEPPMRSSLELFDGRRVFCWDGKELPILHSSVPFPDTYGLHRERMSTGIESIKERLVAVYEDDFMEGLEKMLYFTPHSEKSFKETIGKMPTDFSEALDAIKEINKKNSDLGWRLMDALFAHIGVDGIGGLSTGLRIPICLPSKKFSNRKINYIFVDILDVCYTTIDCILKSCSLLTRNEIREINLGSINRHLNNLLPEVEDILKYYSFPFYATRYISGYDHNIVGLLQTEIFLMKFEGVAPWGHKVRDKKRLKIIISYAEGIMLRKILALQKSLELFEPNNTLIDFVMGVSSGIWTNSGSIFGFMVDLIERVPNQRGNTNGSLPMVEFFKSTGVEIEASKDLKYSEISSASIANYNTELVIVNRQNIFSHESIFRLISEFDKKLDSIIGAKINLPQDEIQMWHLFALEPLGFKGELLINSVLDCLPDEFVLSPFVDKFFSGKVFLVGEHNLGHVLSQEIDFFFIKNGVYYVGEFKFRETYIPEQRDNKQTQKMKRIVDYYSQVKLVYSSDSYYKNGYPFLHFTQPSKIKVVYITSLTEFAEILGEF